MLCDEQLLGIFGKYLSYILYFVKYLIIWPKWGGGGLVIVFGTTFNTILVLSWWLVLLVKKTGVPREKALICIVQQVTDKLDHIRLY